MMFKISLVDDPVFFEALLPYLAIDLEFLFGTKRVSTLDELHTFLERLVWSRCEDCVEMVSHHHEIVDIHSILLDVISHDIDKKGCHAVRLKEGTPPPSDRGDEKRPNFLWSEVGHPRAKARDCSKPFFGGLKATASTVLGLKPSASFAPLRLLLGLIFPELPALRPRTTHQGEVRHDEPRTRRRPLLSPTHGGAAAPDLHPEQTLRPR
jgi:hypothetical protein